MMVKEEQQEPEDEMLAQDDELSQPTIYDNIFD